MVCLQFREKCRDAVVHERNETRQYSERLQHSAHVRHVFGIVALRQPDHDHGAEETAENHGEGDQPLPQSGGEIVAVPADVVGRIEGVVIGDVKVRREGESLIRLVE